MSLFVLVCSLTHAPDLESSFQPRNSIMWPSRTNASAGARAAKEPRALAFALPERNSIVFGELPSSQHMDTTPEQSVRYPSCEADWPYWTLSSSHAKPRAIARRRSGETDPRILGRESEHVGSSADSATAASPMPLSSWAVGSAGP